MTKIGAFRVMSRAVRVAICAFMCEIATRSNHNPRANVCRWKTRFQTDTISDRLRSAFRYQEDSHIFSDRKLKKILALQDAIYDYLSEHAKYNPSLRSPVWEDGAVSKFNFSILTVNDTRGVMIDDNNDKVVLKGAHPFSMFGRNYRPERKNPALRVQNIGAEFYVVPDRSHTLHDPRGLLDRLVMRDCNDIDSLPSPAINTMWMDMKKTQSVQDEGDEPLRPRTSSEVNSMTMQCPYWNHGIAIAVLREEPVIKPYHGIEITSNRTASRQSTFLEKHCGAAWVENHESPDDDLSLAMRRHVRGLDRQESSKRISNRALAGWGTDVTQSVLLLRRFVIPLPDLQALLGPNFDSNRVMDGKVHDITGIDKNVMTWLFPLKAAPLYRLKYGAKLHHPVAHIHHPLPSSHHRPVSFSFNLELLVNDIEMLERYRLQHRLFAQRILKDVVQVEWPRARVDDHGTTTKKFGDIIDGDGVQYTCTPQQHEEARKQMSLYMLPPPSEWVAKGPGGGPVVIVATVDKCRLGECVHRAAAVRHCGIPCQWRQLPVKSERLFRKHIERCPSVMMLILLLKRGELVKADQRIADEAVADETSGLDKCLGEISMNLQLTSNLYTYPNAGPYRLIVIRDPRDSLEFSSHVVPAYDFHEDHNFLRSERGLLTGDDVYSRREKVLSAADRETSTDFDTFGDCLAEVRRGILKEPGLRRLRASYAGA